VSPAIWLALPRSAPSVSCSRTRFALLPCSRAVQRSASCDCKLHGPPVSSLAPRPRLLSRLLCYPRPCSFSKAVLGYIWWLLRPADARLNCSSAVCAFPLTRRRRPTFHLCALCIPSTIRQPVSRPGPLNSAGQSHGPVRRILFDLLQRSAGWRVKRAAFNAP